MEVVICKNKAEAAKLAADMITAAAATVSCSLYAGITTDSIALISNLFFILFPFSPLVNCFRCCLAENVIY